MDIGTFGSEPGSGPSSWPPANSHPQRSCQADADVDRTTATTGASGKQARASATRCQRSRGENNARSRASQDRSGQAIAPTVAAASSASAGADAQGSAIVSASGPSWRNARDRAEDVARALNGRRCGSGWICKCPAHSDAAPSLSIADGRHGRPVFFCHAGCDWRDVADALAAKGLAPRFDPKWKARRCR